MVCAGPAAFSLDPVFRYNTRMSHDQPPPDAQTLAAQLRAKGFTASPPEAQPNADPLDLSGAGKLVVRRERKGRGGKTVTLVSGLDRPPAQLEALARAMRKALGCGSTVEQGIIVLQGDIVSRAQAWLQAHGARKIVLGS